MSSSPGTVTPLDYQFTAPQLNLSTLIPQLPWGHFWKLVGVDGRYTGGLRRFPGFRVLDWYSNISNGASGSGRASGSTSPTLSVLSTHLRSHTPYYFQYISLQKGDLDEVLRGFVIGSSGGGSTYLVFLHYDTEAETWYLANLAPPTGSSWSSTDRVDCACDGRRAYISVEGKGNITLQWKDWGYTANTDTVTITHNTAGGTPLYVKKIDGEWNFVSSTGGTLNTSGSTTIPVTTDATSVGKYPVKAIGSNTSAYKQLCVSYNDWIDERINVVTNTDGVVLPVAQLSSSALADDPDGLPAANEEDVNFVAASNALRTSGGTFTGSTTQDVSQKSTGSLQQLTMGPGDAPIDLEGFDLIAADFNAGIMVQGGVLEEGTVKIRFRWFDQRRQIYSPLSATYDADVSDNYAVKLTFSDDTVSARLSEGFNFLVVYRTVTDGTVFYPEQVLEFPYERSYPGRNRKASDDCFGGLDQKSATQTGPSDTDYYVYVGGISAQHNPTGLKNVGTLVGGPSGDTKSWSLGLADISLVRQPPYDPILDRVDDVPRSGRIAAYQDKLLMGDWSEDHTEGNNATVRWSTLLGSSVENFPLVDHWYKPVSYGDALLGLAAGGDFAYAVRPGGVTRFQRSGTVMQVNELYDKIGGHSRYGFTTMGNALWLVTSLGLVRIDGASGRQDIVGAIERVFSDPTYFWRNSLANVSLVYDGELGALMALNTATDEMYLLWLNTGLVTSLEDVPFVFGTEGPHPENGGQPISFWVKDLTTILIPDFDRTADQLTLRGEGPMKFAATSGTSTVIQCDTDVDGTLLTQLPTGFYAHALTGNLRGEKSKIVSAASTVLVVEGFSAAPDAGSIFAIAPVVMDIRCNGLRGTQKPDLHGRKQLKSMACVVDIIEDTNSNAALGNTYHVYRMEGGDPVISQEFSLDEDPEDTIKATVVAGKHLYPGVRIVSPDVDLALHGLLVSGIISGSMENTQPEGH